MAEDKTEPRDFNLRKWAPWTLLFRGFQVAMDPKKLLLAAGGIFVMAVGWWLLAAVFYGSSSKPDWRSGKYETTDPKAWERFKRDRRAYNLLYRAAGRVRPEEGPERIDAGDLAERPEDFETINNQIGAGKDRVTFKT